MGTEFELKYRADAARLAAIAAEYPGGTEIAMTTTYYDTPDGSLSARKWTLRHRQEGTDHVCTLKTPGSHPGERGEWEVNCEDIHSALSQLCALSEKTELEALTAGGIIPTCGARFIRIAVPLTIGSSTAELALDRGELVNGEKSLPFAEMEVELKEGSREDIIAFAQALARRFCLTPEPKSKYYRARMLGQEE